MYKLIEFNELGDSRGTLVAIESCKTIPFDIKRIFYLYHTEETSVRGCHANRNSQFVLIPISGECKVKIRKPDGVETVISLNKPNVGLWLERMVWKEMFDFVPDTALLVLSDHYYDKAEYIHDFDEYVKAVGSKPQ